MIANETDKIAKKLTSIVHRTSQKYLETENVNYPFTNLTLDI